MNRNLAKVFEVGGAWQKTRNGITVGRLANIDTDGRTWVELPGGRCTPARFLSTAFSAESTNTDLARGAPVLLVFENDDISLPIILGTLSDKILFPRNSEIFLPGNKPQNAVLDGKTVTLKAFDQIQLRCGKSEVLLTKDGRVVIKGVEIVSRGVRTNKIKGGSVQIN